MGAKRDFSNRALLIKDPSKRADISYVENSNWYKGMRDQLAQLNEDEPIESGSKSNNVIEKLIGFGFPIEAIKDTIDKKKLNHIHACFYLLKS